MRTPTADIARVIIVGMACILCSGCQTLMRDLQFANVDTGLFPMQMELRVGDGRVDARELMEAQTYVGEVESPNVTVRYPQGMESLAQEVAEAFERAIPEIRARTGVTWAFRPIIHLLPIDSEPGGFRLRIPIRGHREMNLPLLVRSDRLDILPMWSRGIAHEITEASMLASLNPRELVLGDYCLGGAGLVNETRWFRDGVSDLAGDILNQELFGDRYQPPAHIYESLARVRESLLDWDNCAGMIGPDVYYDASLGLVYELINHGGEDAIARVMETASQSRHINGSTLRRAVRDVTGLELRDFLSDYRVLWLGMDLKDSRRDGTLVGPGNMVRVGQVYRGTPADKWKLRPGDVILSADGQPVISSAWLTHYVAALEPRSRVRIEFERSGERHSHLMMVDNR